MKKKQQRQPKYRLLKVGCLSAGLLSISNPTQVFAADIGILDLHNGGSLGTLANPFPRAPMGVHVAAGDLDGDGRADIIMGPGRGDDHVVVTESVSFNYTKIKWDYYPQKAGVRVATGDVTGDGIDDLILSPSTGRYSPVEFLKVQFPLGAPAEASSVAQFANVFDGFSGGVSIATSDLDGDGGPDDVLAGRLSCACGRPIKKWPSIVSGAAGFEDIGPPVPSGQGGVQIATGDLDGDGLDEILMLPIKPTSGISTPLISRSPDKHKNGGYALNLFSEPAGVHIAMGDLDNDGIAELVVGSARGSEPYVNVYKIQWDELTSSYFVADKHQPTYDFSSYSNLGIRVALGDVNGDNYADLVFAPAGVPEPATFGSLLLGMATWLLGGRRRRRAAPPG